MARPRVIVTLLVDENERLVKSIRFGKRTYIGEPLNVAKILSEKCADELVLLDIDASARDYSPRMELVESIVSESFVPVAYGGGVQDTSEMADLFYLGVDKVILKSAAEQNPILIEKAARLYGSQAVVVCLEYGGGLFSKIAMSLGVGGDVTERAKNAEALGAGELLLYCVDRDGTYRGVDRKTLEKVVESVTIPVIGCGGARDYEDLRKSIADTHCAGIAAGSLFCFQGQGTGVLIRYPDEKQLTKITGTVL